MTQIEPSSKNVIIAISAHDDAHLAVVRPYLDQPLLVIDPLAVTVGLDLSFTHQPGKDVVLYKGWPLEAVRSIWYRKPTVVTSEMLQKIDPSVREYTSDALAHHCELLRSQFPDARWVSPYYAIKQADDKSHGLRMAASVGLRTPATLFTASPKLARQFITDNKDVIVKSLARTHPYFEDKGATMFFARRVNPETIDLSGLQWAPAVFQQAIDVVYDIRATVVDNEVFASKITYDEDSHSEVRDWRRGHFTETVHFEAYPDLPEPIARQCIELTKKLGLLFSTIDLVRDKAGAYWFLETNPNGQWAFVDDPTAERIGQALARLLQA